MLSLPALSFSTIEKIGMRLPESQERQGHDVLIGKKKSPSLDEIPAGLVESDFFASESTQSFRFNHDI